MKQRIQSLPRVAVAGAGAVVLKKTKNPRQDLDQQEKIRNLRGCVFSLISGMHIFP